MLQVLLVREFLLADLEAQRQTKEIIILLPLEPETYV